MLVSKTVALNAPWPVNSLNQHDRLKNRDKIEIVTLPGKNWDMIFFATLPGCGWKKRSVGQRDDCWLTWNCLTAGVVTETGLSPVFGHNVEGTVLWAVLKCDISQQIHFLTTSQTCDDRVCLSVCLTWTTYSMVENCGSSSAGWFTSEIPA